MATPYALIELDEIESTQDEAFSQADRAPVLVVAGHQTAGRGRFGRRWVSAPRALAASLAVRPTAWPAERLGCLSLVAALAGRAALSDDVVCKWPNDLIRDDVKVAGILLEAAGEVVTIGLGVNLWWPDPPPGIGAVFASDPGPPAVRDTAVRWCEDLLVRIKRGADEWGRSEYRRSCRTIGRNIRWHPEGVGTAVDIDDDGRLVVQTGSTTVRLASGEVWEVG